MRKLLCVTLATSLSFALVADADIVKERKREDKVPIAGLSVRAYTERFKKNEPARAFASGNFLTNFGLYVFDANGNCVAKNDQTHPVTADDCHVVWIPPDQQSYLIEVRNAGIDSNSFQFAVR